jgi:hypothetical protein
MTYQPLSVKYIIASAGYSYRWSKPSAILTGRFVAWMPPRRTAIGLQGIGNNCSGRATRMRILAPSCKSRSGFFSRLGTALTRLPLQHRSWLDGHAETLSDALLWPLWDRIADATLIESAEADDA